MKFGGRVSFIVAMAALAVMVIGPRQAEAQKFSAREMAIVKGAKFSCYEALGGATDKQDPKAQMVVYEKRMPKNRASTLRLSSSIKNLKFYYGMFPIEKLGIYDRKWKRVYLGVQKVYVGAGSKCSVYSSTSQEEFLRMNCHLPSCRLINGWQKMIVKSSDAPD